MKNLNKLSLLLLAGLIAFAGCKEDEGSPIEGKGTNFFNMPASTKAVTLVGISAAEAQTVNLAQIIRSVVSQAELSNAATVKLAFDNTVIEAWNADTNNLTKFEPLPADAFTSDPLDFTFNGGEFSKFLKVNIDPTKIADLSKKYALALRITDSGSYGIANKTTALFQIIIKNQYDGLYHSIGYFQHPTAPREIDRDKTLTTIDANTVETEFGDLGGSGWLMWLRVNPDNTVTVIPKGSASAGTTMFDVNQYNPATRTFTLHYKYLGGNGERIINEDITLK